MDKTETLFAMGQRIRRLREAKGYTLEELATMAGYTSDTRRSTMKKIESGQSDLPASKIKALSVALGVSPSELISGIRPDPDEERLIAAYRKAPPELQQAVRTILGV